MKIKAPWTDEQVAALNRWQAYGFVHEFTCPNDHKMSVPLEATKRSWVCPACGYTQDWAHDFMFEEHSNPLETAFAANAAKQRARQRPANYDQLSPQEQWQIDKALGILDWK